MSSEETKQEPGAWEVIAGEWPPLVRGNKPHSPLEAWGWWEEAAGITRRAYAESIAPRLVREAAAKKYGDSLFCVEVNLGEVNLGGGWSEVKVWCHFHRQQTDQGNKCVVMESGPDICTAALAAVRALEDGESK